MDIADILAIIPEGSANSVISIVLLVMAWRAAKWLAPLVEKRIQLDHEALNAQRVALESIAPVLAELRVAIADLHAVIEKRTDEGRRL